MGALTAPCRPRFSVHAGTGVPFSYSTAYRGRQWSLFEETVIAAMTDAMLPPLGFFIAKTASVGALFAAIQNIPLLTLHCLL